MSETHPQSLGELKVLILNRVEAWTFEIEALLVRNEKDSSEKAMRALWELFVLLPPDIRESVKDAEEKHRQLRGRQDKIKGTDPVHSLQQKLRYSYSFNAFIRETIGRIQKLLYERYLVEERKGMLHDPARGKKSGEGEHGGFERRVRARD